MRQQKHIRFSYLLLALFLLSSAFIYAAPFLIPHSSSPQDKHRTTVGNPENEYAEVALSACQQNETNDSSIPDLAAACFEVFAYDFSNCNSKLNTIANQRQETLFLHGQIFLKICNFRL